MIDIEQSWNPAHSAVENLQVAIDSFYDTICNHTVTPSLEEIRNMDSRTHFAYNCKCGKQHVFHPSVWNKLSLFLRTKRFELISSDSEEAAVFSERLTLFYKEVNKVNIRDYAEPFLRASEEGKFIEKAVEIHKRRLNAFIAEICSSALDLNSQVEGGRMYAYQCPVHEKTHYISSQKGNAHWKGLTSVPNGMANQLSPLSIRIITRDNDALQRDFKEQYPSELIIQSDVVSKPQKKKNKKFKKAKLNPVLISEEKTIKQTPSDRRNLYILPPKLMSDDWLIEFQVCGRKTAMLEEAAKKEAAKHKGAKTAYLCSYGAHWHVGAGKGKKPPRMLAKEGLRWYERDYKKANRFIHRIMMEEF